MDDRMTHRPGKSRTPEQRRVDARMASMRIPFTLMLATTICFSLQIVETVAVAQLATPAIESSSQSGNNDSGQDEADQTSSENQDISIELAEESIEQLIADLDSDKFRTRDSATSRLSSLGATALGPMANHSLSATPESVWRIRKCIKQIGTNGNEETFLKAAGLLKLLYGSRGVELEKQTQILLMEWNVKRKDEAIAALRASGAEVTDTFDETRQLARHLIEFEMNFGGDPLSQHGGESDEQESDESIKPASKRRRRMSVNERRRMVAEIMNASIEENRQLLLDGNSAESAAAVNHAAELTGVQPNPQQVRGGFRIGGFRNQPVNRGTVSVKIDSNFSGNDDDLRQLAHISTLTLVEFHDQKIDRGVLEVLRSIPNFRQLKIENCEISSAAVKQVGLPDALAEVVFENQKLDSFLCKRIATAPSLSSITIDDCEIDDANLARIVSMDPLSRLELGGMELGSSVFEDLASSGITSVVFSGCKFDQEDYRNLQLQRHLNLSFTPRAFLGVRSQLNGVGCQISEVIPETGADKGGMEVDDVIESVNGQPIVVFEDLRTQIAMHDVGDTLEITVLRGGEPVDLKVVLSAYEDAPRE